MNASPPTILIAEDDTHIREGLVDTLESEGYTVISTNNGQAALDAFESANRIDLVLLDLMMPERNGYDVCRTIRGKDSQVPVIMLTAKSEEIDKVVGLELGADDYVTKPFGVRELLARIAAALRRSTSRNAHDISTAPPSPPFPFGEATVDPLKYEITLDNRTEPITERELTLLRLFSARPNEVLSRNYLLDRAWGIDYAGTTRTLDQHIAQLRKKVESAPSCPATIVTVHGIGYRYVPR